MKRKLLLLALLFSATAFVARANNGPGNGEDCAKKDIGGGVINADTRKPMSNVVVTAYTNSKKEKAVTTDNSGSYSFSDLKPGTYKLVFEKSGFKKVTKDKVVIRGDEASLLNIEMDEETEFPIIPGQILFSDF